MLSCFERSSEVNVEVVGGQARHHPATPVCPKPSFGKTILFRSCPHNSLSPHHLSSRQSTSTDIWSNSPRWTLSTLAISYPLLTFLILPSPLLSFKGVSTFFPPGSRTHKSGTPYYKETPTDIETGKLFRRLSSPYKPLARHSTCNRTSLTSAAFLHLYFF